MANNTPYSAIDIPEVMSRNLAARDIVSGFASATPTLSIAWQHLQAALADARDLATEVTRLSVELAAARLRHANALAAMRATIGAQRDGEPDPLYYIRDELSVRSRLGLAVPRSRCAVTTFYTASRAHLGAPSLTAWPCTARGGHEQLRRKSGAGDPP